MYGPLRTVVWHGPAGDRRPDVLYHAITKQERGFGKLRRHSGLCTFPLHTDLAHPTTPPRYFILCCIIPAGDVCTLALPWATANPVLGSIDTRKVGPEPLPSPIRRVDEITRGTFKPLYDAHCQLHGDSEPCALYAAELAGSASKFMRELRS